tara:strand:- start:6 stop:215 length:210 start_codon:yes stop_codon:yes gene_type:complete
VVVEVEVVMKVLQDQMEDMQDRDQADQVVEVKRRVLQVVARLQVHPTSAVEVVAETIMVHQVAQLAVQD